MALKLREGGVIWKEVDGETLLLDLATSTYLATNESAALLWRLLGEGTTREALEDALKATYDLSADGARADVAEFLQDCEARGYLDDSTG